MGQTYTSKAPDELGNVNWTATENKTWSELITRQEKAIQDKASKIFLHGLDILKFPQNKIPQIPDINEKLKGITGWSITPVPALIQPQEFYELLAQKSFPAATFIRVPVELDYIQEPDIFHEIYGHVPLLTSKEITNFMFRFGQLALRAPKNLRRKLFRIFWFTIEFGMIYENNKPKALGAGILSSIGETNYCVSSEPKLQNFNLEDVVRTPYRIDIMQPLYYVLKDLDQLASLGTEKTLELLKNNPQEDFKPLFELKGKTLDTESGSM